MTSNAYILVFSYDNASNQSSFTAIFAGNNIVKVDSVAIFLGKPYISLSIPTIKY